MSHFRINESFEIILQLLRKPSHGRQLSETLNIPLTTIQRSLKQLQQQNIITFQTEGRNKTYELKKNLQAKATIIQAEQYKLLKLLAKYPKLQPILEDLKNTFPGNLIIFGSYAKFQANKESDIDIFLEAEELSVKKKTQQIHSKLSIKLGKLGDDHLSKEILKDHVILRGVEEFHETFTF